MSWVSSLDWGRHALVTDKVVQWSRGIRRRMESVAVLPAYELVVQ